MTKTSMHILALWFIFVGVLTTGLLTANVLAKQFVWMHPHDKEIQIQQAYDECVANGMMPSQGVMLGITCLDITFPPVRHTKKG